MNPLPHALYEGGNEFFGTSPYFAMPAPQLPAQRSQGLPPITAPQPGSRRKAGVPPQVTPGWYAQVGGLTYGPGGGPGQGIIQSAQPIADVYGRGR